MYRLTVVQFAPRLLDPAHNLGKMRELTKGLKTDLIVFPELATSGYVFRDQAEVIRVAESVPASMAFRSLSNLSRQLDASLVYGFPELAEGRVYNSAVLINPDGSWFIYRKSHLFFREKQMFAPGDSGFFACRAKRGVRVGMMICFDWQFPEAARALALQGAQVICHPSNLVLSWGQAAMLTRSLENRVFSVTANRIGHESNNDFHLSFTGHSQVADTRGELLFRLSMDREEVRTAEINPAEADNKSVTDVNDVFSDRRPALFSILSAPAKGKQD